MNINFAELDPSLDENLRRYQVENKSKIYEAWEAERGVMLQMPTGTGKTRLFVSIINDLQGSEPQDKPKILILAHHKELIDQIRNEISVEYGIPCSLIMGQNIESEAFSVQVASVLSLVKRLDKWSGFNFDFIIIDEAHHVPAVSYQRIIKSFPKAKLLGVTATPYRMNGRAFTVFFEKLIESQPVIDFIKQGHLCDYDYYSIQDIDKIHEKILNITKFDINGDYLESEMMKIMDKTKILSRIVDTYLKYAKGKKGILYTISQEHNIHICEQFKQAGIRAEAIDSKTKSNERDIIVKQFREGKFEILCNVNILSEGFDCQDVEFIQLARPTRSLGLFLQQVGRGLRFSPGKKVIFLDNVGSYHKFGLPSKKRNWQKYFNGFDKLNPPDESPNKSDDEDRQVNYIRSFDEGEEDLDLIESTIDDETYKIFLEDVINRHNDATCQEEAFRNYLSKKKYCYGTINNYIRVIPIHIDRFIKDEYNPGFSSIYYIIDPDILTKIQQMLYSNDKFKNKNPRDFDRQTKAIERYIVFAKEYFVEFCRSPEEIEADYEARKKEEIRNNQINSFYHLSGDLVSIFKLYESKGQAMPKDIFEKFKELQEIINMNK